MAPSYSKSCKICTTDFDATYHQTVALPCGHNFCLTCLVRLQASDSPVCPQCSRNFKNFYLPRVSSGTSMEDMDKYWEGYFKNPKMDTLCKEHLMAYVFWNEELKRLCCNKCIVELDLEPGKLTLIEDKLANIKSDISRRTSYHLTNLNAEHSKHHEMRTNSTEALEDVKRYRQAFKQLEHDIQTRTSDRDKQIKLAKNIEKRSHTIQSARDIHSMVAYMDVLDGLQSTMKPPLQRQKTPMSLRFPTYPPKSPEQMKYRAFAELMIDLKDAALSWPGLISFAVYVVVILVILYIIIIV